MAFGIVLSKQAQGGIEQVLHAHHPQFALESVGRYAKVTAHEALEPIHSRNIIKMQIIDNQILFEVHSKSKSF